MKNPVRPFAFVRSGDFSGANAHILAQLRLQFPNLEPDVIDVSDLHVLERSDAARLLVNVAREYGLSQCLGTGRIRARALRTVYAFRKIRARLLERLSRRDYAFTFQTQSLLDASVPGVPHFVYTDHTNLANLTYPASSEAQLASAAWREAERSIYHNARINFTMSAHVSRSLAEDYGCPKSRIQCVFAGSNVVATGLEDLGHERFTRKTILFVGIDWERKGGPVLLEAFRKVRRTHPTAELVVVGCSPKVSVPGCRIVGRVPLAEVAGFYRTASVFCLPTNIEPFGLVFLEAFAHGLPIIATDLGAIPDFLEEGRSGYRVVCNDAGQLAARLDALLADPARCAAFGARGQALVNERYTWRSTAVRIAAHIRPHINPASCIAPPLEPVTHRDGPVTARLAM